MERKIYKFSNSVHSFLLIFLCFSLLSAGYLSWLYHLMDILPSSKTADLLSEVVGYLFQAAGIGLFTLSVSFFSRLLSRMGFLVCSIVYILLLIPSVLSEAVLIVLISGFLMNLFCGIISGYYLYVLAVSVEKQYCATVFGLAYGLSTITLWFMTLPGDLLHSSYSLIIYALLAIIVIIIYDHGEKTFTDIDTEFNRTSGEDRGESDNNMTGTSAILSTGIVPLAFVTVILLSYVKNLGFIFPSSDITSGTSLELSRIFYGAGMVIAGYISDRKRSLGAVFCAASLVIPFTMLVLAKEPLPGLVLWSLNYFFYGFLSVFRVILFTDMAKDRKWMYLAGCGLLSGRIGDAAGNYTYILLNGKASVLVVVAATLFVLTIFLFFQLYQQLYMVQPAGNDVTHEISEEERFEAFCQRYNCSRRERDILRALLEEQSNVEIADALFISESTVKFHIHNLLKKTDCKNRIELLALYRLTNSVFQNTF